MVIRVVKLSFERENIDAFKQILADSKEAISAFPGVKYLEILQDINDSTIFFTYSHWESETDLNTYRNSSLFKAIWAKTKPLFSSPAEAWSNKQLHKLT